MAAQVHAGVDTHARLASRRNRARRNALLWLRTLWLDVPNPDVCAALLAMAVYGYLLISCGGFKGYVTLSSTTLLFGRGNNEVVPWLVAANLTEESLAESADWMNVDPAHCLTIIAQRHNTTLQLDPSIPSARLLTLEHLNASYYGLCNVKCSTLTIDADCVVHYIAPSRILDDHLRVLLPNANGSFAATGDYFLLFEDVLTEYRAASGNARTKFVDIAVTTVSSVFFGLSSTLQCGNQPCVVLDAYTSVVPRAHIADDGQAVFGFSIPWRTNAVLEPVCTSAFSPTENRHRVETKAATVAASSQCRIVNVTTADSAVFMTAYPTDYLGDHVLVDSSGHRLTIEPQYHQFILEDITSTTLDELGWGGVQRSHILRNGQIEVVSRATDVIRMVNSSVVPNFALIVLQLAFYYAITYSYVLKGIESAPMIHTGLSDIISRSSINYVFLLQCAFGCVSATGVLVWVGSAYQQVIPWEASAWDQLPLHSVTLLAVLQYYIASACGRAVIRRNMSRNAIRTRVFALAQGAAVCAVAIATIVVGCWMTYKGNFITMSQEDGNKYTSDVRIGVVIGVNVAPHVCIEVLSELAGVRVRVAKAQRELNAFEEHCIGTRIEDVVSVVRLRWVEMSSLRLQECLLIDLKRDVLVRQAVVVTLGFVYVPDGLVRVRDLLPNMLMAWAGGILNTDNQLSVTLWRLHPIEDPQGKITCVAIESGCHFFVSPVQARRIVGDIGGFESVGNEVPPHFRDQ